MVILTQRNIAAIDLGIDNLATLTSNQPGFLPVLVSGRIIKSINRYYNQRKAKLQSLLPSHQKILFLLMEKLTRKKLNLVVEESELSFIKLVIVN
ncbi:transposase [Anabaena catenula]|uniref:transposase n=1 Tax=Anabaena catenula TaxID=1296320 RepID=UPI0030DAF774